MAAEEKVDPIAEMNARPILPLKEYLPFLTNGNDNLTRAFLAFDDQKMVFEKCIAGVAKAENQAAFKAIMENAAFDPVMKAHKSELLFSKIYKAELKASGFTTGIDVKKCLHHLNETKLLGKITDDEKAIIEGLEAKLKEASEVATPKSAEGTAKAA